MLVADTNVLIELFLPTENSAAVQQWRAADKDWQLPGHWVFEFRHILLKYKRAEWLDLDEAVDAEVVVLAQELQCPLLTFDRKLLQLYPDVALKPGS